MGRQEIQIDQDISGFDVLVGTDTQKRAELVVAVVGEPVPIRDQDQQEVEQELLMSEVRPEAIAEKPMLDGSESSLDHSNPLGTDQLLLNHDRSPFGEKANTVRGPAPIESSFAIASVGNFSKSVGRPEKVRDKSKSLCYAQGP
jgi:hypothetical protein